MASQNREKQHQGRDCCHTDSEYIGIKIIKKLLTNIQLKLHPTSPKTICNFADQRHFSTSVLATHTFLLLHQSFWQNSILSSFGPLIMKNITPLSQNGSCSIPSVMTSYPFSQIFLYISSISHIQCDMLICPVCHYRLSVLKRFDTVILNLQKRNLFFCLFIIGF